MPSASVDAWRRRQDASADACGDLGERARSAVSATARLPVGP